MMASSAAGPLEQVDAQRFMEASRRLAIGTGQCLEREGSFNDWHKSHHQKRALQESRRDACSLDGGFYAGGFVRTLAGTMKLPVKSPESCRRWASACRTW